MIENMFFALIIGIGVVLISYFFHLPFVHPLILIGIIFILMLPGIYAAVKSGPFVPSARKRHKIMLKLAAITSHDIVYDMGCGDGRLVFSAAKKAKQAIGYELSIPLIIYGKILSLFHSNTSIRFGNIWKQDYSDANVIFCYLLPAAMNQFYTEIWPQLKPGTRVVSNAFAIKAVEPQAVEEKVYLYVKD